MFNVAFWLSVLVSVAGYAAIIWYGKRRPVGAPISWGEAIAASTFGFFLMFWVYGVVPHQWLTWTGNELSWRPDRQLVGPELFFTGDEGLVEFLMPFTVNWENISHIGAVVIYGIALAAHVAIWAIWQDRAKPRPAEIPTSEYGRPLVKQG